jgi:hypothetical protein
LQNKHLGAARGGENYRSHAATRRCSSRAKSPKLQLATCAKDAHAGLDALGFTVVLRMGDETIEASYKL